MKLRDYWIAEDFKGSKGRELKVKLSIDLGDNLIRKSTNCDIG